MTRKKVKLAYIFNDSARKATYLKRKKSLLKKVSELKTLCDIDACAIIFSPYDREPEIWPSHSGVQQVLSQFKRMPEMEKGKKMVNQDSFLRQRIAKADEHLRKQQKDNYEKEMKRVMFQSVTGSQAYLNFNMIGLNDLGWQIEKHMMDICKRMKALSTEPHSSNEVEGNNGETSQQPVEKSSSSVDGQMNMEAIQRQQWYADLMSTPREHMGFGGDDMMFPFGVGSSHNNNL